MVELPRLSRMQYLQVFHILFFFFLVFHIVNSLRGCAGKFGRLRDLGEDSDLFEGLHGSCEMKLTMWIYLAVT